MLFADDALGEPAFGDKLLELVCDADERGKLRAAAAGLAQDKVVAKLADAVEQVAGE